MALFVLETSDADKNLNWLLSEGYTIDGVEVLDDDEEGYTGSKSDSWTDISIDSAKYEKLSRDEKEKIDKETAKELGEIEDRLETAKRDFKSKFSNRPMSWFESKLIGFKKMLVKFRARHKATKGNKSKTILQKIIYVITNIIKFITDKLLVLAKHSPIGRDGRRYDDEKRNARTSLAYAKSRAAKQREMVYNSNALRKQSVDTRVNFAATSDYLDKVNEKIDKDHAKFRDEYEKSKKASDKLFKDYKSKSQKERDEWARKSQEDASRMLDELLNN